MYSKVRCRFWLGAILTTGLLTAAAAADVPRLIQYQGKLIGANGAALPGPVALRIRLYPHPTNPTPVLFDETHAVVDLTRGLFSILIGANTVGGVPDSAVAPAEVYIGVNVDGGNQLNPRRQVVTAPYTFKSQSAERLVKPGTMETAVSVDSQGRVGLGGGSPDASAALDVSSSSGGLLPPRMTTTERDAIGSPAEGLMVFNSTTGCPNMRINGVWRVFGAPDTPGAITGPTDVCSGSTGVAYSVGDVPGAASFQWDVPPGSTVASGQGTAFVTVDFGPLSGTVAVKAVNACGTSAANALPMAVSGSPPATPQDTLPSIVFANTSEVLSVPAVFGATGYTWTVPAGWSITSGQGNNAITVAVDSSVGNLVVTADNACGSSSPRLKAVAVSAANGSPIGYTGEIEQIAVPAGVTSMTIEAWGAQGGDGTAGAGGLGARMRGDFAVTPGDVLKVLVGQRGVRSENEGGGGGGTFVADAANNPLIVAGGGGGTSSSGNPLGTGGTTSTSGEPGTSGGGPGGTGGSGGGNVSGQGAAGGGGFNGNGADSGWNNGASQGGRSFLNGGAGGQSASGAHGGFGGGGSGHGNCIGGGGGGGYSGGGSGRQSPSCTGGGGGGSFNSGTSPDDASGVRTGDGQVTFSW